MPVEWSLEALVPASPDAVFAWMTDFQEDDHARPAFLEGARVPKEKWAKHASRRTVAAREGNIVHIEDTWGRNRMKMTATLDPAARTLRLAGGFGYASTWKVEPAPGGARVTVRGAMGGIFALLFARGIKKQMADDFDGHVNDLRVSLAARSPSP